MDLSTVSAESSDPVESWSHNGASVYVCNIATGRLGAEQAENSSFHMRSRPTRRIAMCVDNGLMD